MVPFKINNIILKHQYSFAGLAGCLSKFCFNNKFGILFFIMSIYILIKIIYLENCKKRVFKIGYYFGFFYFLSSLFWVSGAFNCVGLDNYGYIAVLFLSLYLGLFPGITCFLSKYFQENYICFVLSFCVFWSLSEYVRGFLFTGFPWNIVGYLVVDIPFIRQSYDIIGSYGMSFIILIITLSLFSKKTSLFSVFIIFIMLIYGVIKPFITEYKENVDQYVRIVQPSIPQKDKMDASKFMENLERHISMSEFEKLPHTPNITVWGEAAVPCFLDNHPDLVNYISQKMKKNGGILITGAHRWDHGKIYNSVFAIGDNSNILDFYDKKHLLPFGEFIPKFLRFLPFGKITGGDGNFECGARDRLIKIKGYRDFSVLICYEIAFPGEITEAQSPSWILNLTNDAWFGKSDGPFQHLVNVRIRAIEEGIPIVRCANNGVSCVIDSFGNLLSFLETDSVGVIDAKVPVCQKPTVYSKFGNILFFCCIFISLLILFVNLRGAKCRRY